MASSGIRIVTQVTEVQAVFTMCWHIDTKATPMQRRKTVTIRPGEPDPEWTFRTELSDVGRDEWVPRLNLELCEAFDVFFQLEQRFLVQFLQACKSEVVDDDNPYHREPLDVHTRQIHQMVLFGNELQRDVVTHKNPHPQVVETTILMLVEAFLFADIWQNKNDSDLRDGLEIAVPAIMDTVLALRPDENLKADILVTMEKEFTKAGIF
ncbi:hypothetical protein PG994_008077 [Apiospora phragmitis]|uniref:Uncharacterized protein n=1 Tax=Apiospora phragmitis TaxID=2905665 RepID=A0ABR1US13_9PEZI